MARIGLKMPIVSKILAESPLTYDTGRVLAEMMEAKVNINNSGVEPLYGNDNITETDSGFSDGTIEFKPTDISDANYTYLLGHTLTNVTGGTVVDSKITDIAPYVGFGFYMVRKRNGALSYLPRLFPKVQYSEPSEEAKTKGKSIEWQTDTLTGTILTMPGVAWCRRGTFTTEAAAIDWLSAALNYGGAADKTALNAKIAVVVALDPEDYTSASWAACHAKLTAAQAVSADSASGSASIAAALSELTSAQTALVTR